MQYQTTEREKQKTHTLDAYFRLCLKIIELGLTRTSRDLLFTIFFFFNKHTHQLHLPGKVCHISVAAEDMAWDMIGVFRRDLIIKSEIHWHS